MEIHATETGKRVYLAYRTQTLLCNVQRTGVSLCGVNGPAPDIKTYTGFFENRMQSDAEHCNGMHILLSLIHDFYPEIIGPVMYSQYDFIIDVHELGELPTGDLPDDGSRDNEKKDREELEFIQNYLNSTYDEFTAKQKYSLVLDFVNKTTAFGGTAYFLDKFDAIFRNFVYEYEGRCGHLMTKEREGRLTEKDRHDIEICGTDTIADCWLCGLLCNPVVYNFPAALRVFIEIAQSAAVVERGYEMDWINDKFADKFH